MPGPAPRSLGARVCPQSNPGGGCTRCGEPVRDHPAERTLAGTPRSKRPHAPGRPAKPAWVRIPAEGCHRNIPQTPPRRTSQLPPWLRGFLVRVQVAGEVLLHEPAWDSGPRSRSRQKFHDPVGGDDGLLAGFSPGARRPAPGPRRCCPRRSGAGTARSAGSRSRCPAATPPGGPAPRRARPAGSCPCRLDQSVDHAQGVVLPQPLSPARIMIFRSGTSRLRSSTATAPPG